MALYNNGVNTYLSLLGTTVLKPADGVTSATLNLGGTLLGGFDITAPADGTLIINNTVDIGMPLTIHTAGSAVTLDSSVIAANVLGAVDVTINGGSFSVGSDLISANVLSGAQITFGSAASGGGTSIVGTPESFVPLNLLTALAPYDHFWNTSDDIDDVSLAFTGTTTYTISGSASDQQVVVTQGGNTFTFALNNAGTAHNGLADGTYNTLTGGPLNISNDGSGGTEITLCFFGGTRIATPDGEAAIETLKIGDLVLTADGRTLPVRWVGINTVSTQFADPLRVMPVRIRAGALADNIPTRDLLVSPDHAMFIDGILIQAGALIDGVSIVRETSMPQTFRYYHVEVGDHSLILAEGAPTETFVDNVDRMAFDNWAQYQELYGDDNPVPEMEYARAKSARQVPRNVRALLAARHLSIAEDTSVAA